MANSAIGICLLLSVCNSIVYLMIMVCCRGGLLVVVIEACLLTPLFMSVKLKGNP